MRVDEFDYELPKSLIAQRPLAERDASRLLTLNRLNGEYQDRLVRELPTLLRGDELLVVNNARVIPARLFGRRAGMRAARPAKAAQDERLAGRVEVFLSKQLDADRWQALVRPGRKMPVGERVIFGEDKLEAEVLDRGELGLRVLQFTSMDGRSISDHLYELGHIPLPPYIDREDEPMDRLRYQTVFAKNSGAVAAPTAGLHFTPELMTAIRQRGAEICELTLQVGLGTFQPIKSETLEGHIMHGEAYDIPPETVERIAAARAAGRSVLGVGTTVVRALEAAALRSIDQGSRELILSGSAEATLFITPGFSFRVVNALLTNFHLPKSTLLALVSAFAGRDHTLAAYRHAVQAQYRFYSYGDCMLIR